MSRTRPVSGCRELAFHDGGQRAQGQRWFVDLTFRGPTSDPEPIRAWYFPTDHEYRARLEAGGFRVRSIALFPRPTPLPGDIGDWLETFAEAFLVAARDQAALLVTVRTTLAPLLRAADGRWTADYVRLRFAAERAD